MKKNICLFLLVSCTLVFNLSLVKTNKAESLSLANIEVLQSSALEFVCDQSSTSGCEVKTESGTVAKSTGNWVQR